MKTQFSGVQCEDKDLKGFWKAPMIVKSMPNTGFGHAVESALTLTGGLIMQKHSTAKCNSWGPEDFRLRITVNLYSTASS